MSNFKKHFDRLFHNARFKIHKWQEQAKNFQIDRINRRKDEQDNRRKELELEAQRRDAAEIRYLERVSWNKISQVKEIGEFKKLRTKIEKFGVRDMDDNSRLLTFKDKCDSCNGNGDFQYYHDSDKAYYQISICYDCKSSYGYSRRGTGRVKYKFEIFRNGKIIRHKQEVIDSGCLGVIVLLMTLSLGSLALVFCIATY